MKKLLKYVGFLALVSGAQIVYSQSVIFTEDFESGAANAQWETYYKNENPLIAKPIAEAPKPLTGGGSFVGLLQDADGSFTGSAVAVRGDLNLKDYSIEADVYCYVGKSLSAYSGLVVYADSSKKDFYKLRVDFDASNRINFSGLKSDPNTFLPLFSKDFTGANNAGLFPAVDGWHKLKIEIRSTSAAQTTIWNYFDGTLLNTNPIVDTAGARVTSGKYGLYSFQQSATGLAAYFDNIVIKTLAPTSVNEKEFVNLPEGFALSQNYPNPFNPETRISYQIPSSGFVSLAIYDQLGKEIVTLVSQNQAAGQHYVNWNGKDALGKIVPSGTYFYSLKSGNSTQSKKMILMK